MEIVKGSQEYYDYVTRYMIPSGEESYEIFTLEEDLFVDMVDNDTSYLFTDEQVQESMKANGDTLIIP
jgi:hypothetical protein|tara:strand:- start:157 stop:360 length:204 start_codon:yes stop_codon:yes gene_type:complete